ncbi:hypothetical protein BH683_014550 [Williamsia sp. 1138]|uniref:hypothetical protein n=1 Tax=Williamsia sp. 1138 TaxID=1903117 RepID=UPI000A110B49|nr:hypothetical protein [Williamsia sp. 1138]OZG28255.1 hypothetical protein BH683_014550 [Williamsia sp. 1138]
MTRPIGHFVLGPRSHGVVRYARSVLDAAMVIGADHRLLLDGAPHLGCRAAALECGIVHIHVTDKLFGRSPAAAQRSLLSTMANLRRPVSVTLHDVPQPSDGPGMRPRAAFYAAVARQAAGVIVSSHHEAALFAQFVDASIEVQVVPLMFEGVRVEKPSLTREVTVGVLGFLYPGKGHLETLQAMADLDPSVGFLALGTPSPGHDHLVDDLGKIAADSGRTCEITGFLTDDELRRRMAEVTVPVAYHRHMSASGSINAWISAGRRPLVPRTAYTLELAARSPDVVAMHPNNNDALRSAVADAVASPEHTWTDSAVTTSPTAVEVAQEYDRLLRRWSA